MKRLIPALLALVMVFGLCACGSSAPASTAPAQPAEEAAAPAGSEPADLVAQAVALIASGETEENLNAALELYKQVLEAEPENLDAILGTVDVMIRKGNYENALKWLKTFTLTMPDSPEIAAKIRELESGNIKDSEGKTRLDSGFYDDGKLMWTLAYAYGDDGKLREAVLRDGEGKELDRAEVEFDDHGQTIKGFVQTKDKDNMLSIKKMSFVNTYDDEGHLLTRDDNEGRHWEYTRDDDGNILRLVCYMNGSLLSEEITEYNEAGKRIYEEYHQSGELRWTETWEYDEDGKTTKYDRWYRYEGAPFEHSTRFYDYENEQQHKEILYHDGVLYQTWVTEYDADGKLIARYVYDEEGNLIETDYQ